MFHPFPLLVPSLSFWGLFKPVFMRNKSLEQQQQQRETLPMQNLSICGLKKFFANEIHRI